MKNLELWQRDNRDLKKITILNPEDFDQKKILENLTPDHWGMGLGDSAEIIRRNQILRYLTANPALRLAVAKIKEKPELLFMPEGESSFLKFYAGEHNPYWEIVKGLINELKPKEGLPKDLQNFLAQLQQDLKLEADEKIMATKISGLLKNIAFMEGFVTALVEKRPSSTRIKIVDKENYIHGYKVYKASSVDNFDVRMPRWLRNGLCRFIRIDRLYKWFVNEYKKAEARTSEIIRSFSEGLLTDLRIGIDTFLKEKMGDAPNCDIKVKFYFRYNKQGLTIQPTHIVGAEMRAWFDFSYGSSSAINKKGLKKIKSMAGEQEKLVLENNLNLQAAKVMQYLPKDFFEQIEIKSSRTDCDYRWYALQNLYKEKENLSLYLQLKEQRDYFRKALDEIQSVYSILEMFKNQAMRLNLPLCIPDIQTKAHSGVFFKNLAPLKLISSNQPLTLITLDRINGQMVGLTGRHGGGKSVAGESILLSVYLALSGLPVFAESFSTDIKTVLGSVTNDMGEGSTAQIFVKKVKTLMAGIRKVDAHESLIFIDEIGKGTQQQAGLEIGQAILQALSQGGSSVLFNTQILELAEYAQNELKAICYKVDAKHQFTKGIGGGEIDALVKELGLEKYIKMNKN